MAEVGLVPFARVALEGPLRCCPNTELASASTY